MSNFKDVTVPASEWGHTKPAKIHIPGGSPLPSGKYPLIVAFGGIGVQTPGILNEGLPMVFEKSGTQYGSVAGMEKVGFAVLAIGADPGGYSADHTWMQWAIPYVLKNYPIDPNCIVVTGLSAGGLECIMAVTDPKTAPLFSAAVPMSIAGPGKDYSQLFKNKIYTWFFCGDSEGSYTDFTREAFNQANRNFPESSFKDEVKGRGHCCWDEYSRDTYEGKALQGISIFDFALFYRKGKEEQPPDSNPTGAVPLPGPDEIITTIVTTNAGPIAIYSDGGAKYIKNFDPNIY